VKPLFDHHTAARIATLRAMQGLSFDVPAAHTVYRQSDFEKSKVWRYVFIAGFVVGISALFEPEPQPVVPAAQSTVTKTYASGIANTLSGVAFLPCMRKSVQSFSSSAFTHEGNGSSESIRQGSEPSLCSIAWRTNAVLAESTVRFDIRWS
jgi:hypothetical protein